MADGTHLHLGLLKAWDLWLGGRDIRAEGDFLWGISLVWWSRVGVIAGFLAGLIIVLDLIGEERLKRFGQNSEVEFRLTLAALFAWVAAFFVAFHFLLGWLWAAVIALVFGPMFWVSGLFLIYVMFRAFIVLREGRVMAYARIFALSMLVISAHFTLLTG